jgi:hypothetical protein
MRPDNAPAIFKYLNSLLENSGLARTQVGGDGGIRTHDRVTPIHTFQACAFDHSATSPHCFSAAHPLGVKLRFRKGALHGMCGA